MQPQQTMGSLQLKDIFRWPTWPTIYLLLVHSAAKGIFQSLFDVMHKWNRNIFIIGLLNPSATRYIYLTQWVSTIVTITWRKNNKLCTEYKF